MSMEFSRAKPSSNWKGGTVHLNENDPRTYEQNTKTSSILELQITCANNKGEIQTEFQIRTNLFEYFSHKFKLFEANAVNCG